MAKKNRSFVRFLGESMARQSGLLFYLNFRKKFGPSYFVTALTSLWELSSNCKTT